MRRLGLVAQLGAQPGDDPVRIAQPNGIVRPLHRSVADTAQDRVDESTRRLRRQLDGLADGGVRRHAGEVQLVGTETQQRAQRRLRFLDEEAIDQRIACHDACAWCRRPAR